MNLGEALKAKGWSDRTAGAHVLAAWKRRERRDDHPKSEAIGAKIGLLKKGNDRWWRNHTQALAALAELLRCNPEELLPKGRADARAIAFTEFPELAPLLPGQDPCIVGPHGWVGDIARAGAQQGTHVWLQVPPGGGKSLAIRVLGQGRDGNWVTTTARTLHEALRKVSTSTPMVAEVESVEPATDDVAMAEIAKRQSGVCILASFARPRGRYGGWQVGAGWQPAQDWRERLIRWAQPRVPKPDTLDVEDVLSWLAVIDPDATIFSTPGELLPLLVRAYRAGLPKQSEGLAGLAREWLAQNLGGSQHDWLRRFGPNAVERMVRARLAKLDVPLAPLAIDAWASFVPTDLVPSKSPSPVRNTRRTLRRDDDAPLAKPLEVIHSLADIGALRTYDGGGLDVFPSWVRVGLEREDVMRAVKSSKGNNWALLSVDVSRRHAVDRALDTLSPSDLVIAAREALPGRDDDLVSVATIEALFAAFGRRLATSDWRPSPDATPTLQRLGQRQLQLLALAPKVANDHPLLPLTRHLPGFEKAAHAEWLSAAWPFSFEVPAPARLALDPGWRLPGWSTTLRIAETPGALPWPTHDSVTAPSFRPLWQAARRAVRACQDSTVLDDVHHLLLPWVIIDGESHGWGLGSNVGRALLDSSLGGVVGMLLAAEPEETRARVSATVWPAIVAAEGHPLYALRRLREQQRALFEIVAAYLPTDLAEPTFAAANLTSIGDVGDIVASLPERLRRPFLHVAARQLRTSGSQAIGLGLERVLAYAGREDVDVLVEFVAAQYQLGMNAARRVWAIDPDRAAVEARNALKRSDDAVSNLWFHGAPAERCAGLLDLLAAHEAPLSWAHRWLAEVLPLVGASGPRVFGMMQVRSA